MEEGVEAGDVLSQPTRARLVSLLGEIRRQASTEELARRLGLHVNGVRRHLDRLERAGLVERAKERRGRGRPRDLWSTAPGASPGGQRSRSYADLSRWLTRAIPENRSRLREVERVGREIGRELAPHGVEHSAAGFRQVLTALGFRPEIELDGGGGASCRLWNCPYADAVRESPAVVCTLHRGMTDGLLEQLAPEARLAAFVPHDPDRAGCRVEVADATWTADPEPAEAGMQGSS